MNLLANSVKNSYPHECNNVNTRQTEIKDLWNKVQTKAKERRSRLEDAVGQQIFMNSSKNLINWATDIQETIKVEESVRDVATAEQLKKQHMELGEEIRTKEDEYVIFIFTHRITILQKFYKNKEIKFDSKF